MLDKKIVFLLLAMMFIFTACIKQNNNESSSDYESTANNNFVTPEGESLDFGTIGIKDVKDKTRAINIKNPVDGLPSEDTIVYINSDYNKEIVIPEKAYCIKVVKVILETYKVVEIDVADIKANSGVYLIFIGEFNVNFAKAVYTKDLQLTLNKLSEVSIMYYKPTIKIANIEISPNNTVNPSEYNSNGIYIFDYRYGNDVTSVSNAGTKEIAVIDNSVFYIGEAGEKVIIPGKNGYIICFAGIENTEKLKDIKIGDEVDNCYLDLEVLAATGLSFKNDNIPINNINTIRGAGMVVVYTPNFYSDTTQTNMWGREITVEDSVITKVVPWGQSNSGNSVIPDNGYVISYPEDWDIYNNLNGLKVGDEVEFYTDNSGYKINKLTYNGINTPRNADYLVIFNSSYGNTTGTNEWGFEIVVDKNSVVIMQDAAGNATIPADGYVLSAIGTPKQELMDAFSLGATVYIDRKNSSIYIVKTLMHDIDSSVVLFEQLRTKAEESLAALEDLDYIAINQDIDVITNLLVQADNADATEAYTIRCNAMGKINELAYKLIPTKVVEDRGAWHVLTEKNDDQVRKALEFAASINLNHIIIDTWSNGYVLYNTDLEGVLKNPEFGDFDPIEAFTRLGNEYGIDIHVSMSGFVAGNADYTYPEGHVSEHKDWFLLSKTGYNYSITGDGKYYTLNPYNREARAYLIAIATELSAKYDIKGFHYDYTRFPQPSEETADFGYNDDIISVFMEQYNTAKNPKTYKEGEVLWRKWCEFRCDIVSDFVEECSAAVRNANEDIVISAAVFAGLDEMTTSIFQNARDWCDRGAVDTIMPMNYTPSFKNFSKYSLRGVDVVKNNGTYLTMGIGTFEFYTPDVILEQIEYMREIGDGVCYFTLFSLTKPEYVHLLTKGVYREKAIPVYSVNAASAIKADLLDKIENLYKPNTNYSAELTSIADMLNNSDNIDNIITFAKQSLEEQVQIKVLEQLKAIKKYT
ncbi:MAG: hypothetical protein A2Y17_06195 [Clostridiales bacterium GWF2_38_85]|nr:MAG: hypothetical protein A2Y17_06195 [Clostridiales bacterium GWF2_38_85]HBL85482.1 hypothetical protein [Clostridiales bacterium]